MTRLISDRLAVLELFWPLVAQFGSFSVDQKKIGNGPTDGWTNRRTDGLSRGDTEHRKYLIVNIKVRRNGISLSLGTEIATLLPSELKRNVSKKIVQKIPNRKTQVIKT